MDDPTNNKNPKTNYKRRLLGALICLSPLGLGVASLGWSMSHSHPLPPFVRGSSIVLITLAVLVGVFNFYLSWIRPLLLQNQPGYRFVSGIPIVGTILVTAGILIGFGGALQAIAGMGELLLDTGSSVWFLFATWKDTSLWDA